MTIDPANANDELLRGAYGGNLERVKAALEAGAEVDFIPPETGLSALHLAVGRSHLAVVKYLIESAKAAIMPDGFGRWPTVIAAQCEASEEVCDYIVEHESALHEGQYELE